MRSGRINRRQFHALALGGIGAFSSRGWAADAPARLKAPTSAPATQPVRRDYCDVFSSDAPEFVKGSFTVCALPDTQYYCAHWPAHYARMTTWIKENREKRNIVFVCHLGDITHNNNEPQWEVAKKSMSILDGQVPYCLIVGNHDLGRGGTTPSRDTLLNRYFTVAEQRKHSQLGGVMDETQLENNFHTFKALGHDFLVLGLEYGPREAVVKWADGVLSAHPDHRVILSTHAYMYYDETRYDSKKYGQAQRWNPHFGPFANLPGGVNDGQDLWEKLVSKHKNVFMTLNGHVLEDGLGRLTSRNDAGGDVHQLLVNYQNRFEGGEGYMRLLEFHPDGKTVQIKAYSPSTNKYKVDSQNQFTLEVNLAPA